MDRLEDKHIKFLRLCTENPHKVQVAEGIAREDLQQMVEEGLLIIYHGLIPRYTVTRNGQAVAQAYGPSDELVKLAKQALLNHGYTDEQSEELLKEHGPEEILKSAAQHTAGITKGQREVTPPTDAQGKSLMKFYKP